MKNVKYISQINSGIKSPNIDIVIDVDLVDYEVKFYSGNSVINHEEYNVSILPGWVNYEGECSVYNIKPKFNKSVYLEIISKGSVVEKVKIHNTIFNSLYTKYLVFYNNVYKRKISPYLKFRLATFSSNIRIKFIADILTKKVGSLDSPTLDLNPNNIYQYKYWIDNIETFSEVKEYDYNPKISIVIPVYNCPIKYLKECLDSILNQTYQNFEICLCDDASTDPEVEKTLKEYEKKDERIKVVYSKVNGHISKATNNAIAVATGDFIAFMDNDDLLSPFAFNEVIKVLNEDKTADLIYSDEDKLDMKGRRCYPAFKPDFCPDTLLGNNYICHLVVVRKTLVDEVNGIREGYEGVQDHDFLIRLTEITSNVVHIPKILYHWRMIPGSTAVTVENKGYVSENGIKMVKDTLKRRGLDGEVTIQPPGSTYRATLTNNNELISIIIPTRDRADLLETCLRSIYEKSSYKNFEIIVVDNNSEEAETFKLFEEYKKHDNFRVLRLECEFNYSYINNEAVKISNGEYILFLNNDTEVINENWMEAMLGHARVDHIGAVGALLYYPDNTIQHAGVVVGAGSGVAGHVHLRLPMSKAFEVNSGRIPTNFSAVTAACLMVKKDKFIEVGMFNEKDLVVAFNDIDLCLKLIKKSYRNIVHPEARLYHYESISRGSEDTKEKIVRFMSEIDYMRTNHYDIIDRDPCYNINYSRVNAFELRIVDRNVEDEYFNTLYK